MAQHRTLLDQNKGRPVLPSAAGGPVPTTTPAKSAAPSSAHGKPSEEPSKDKDKKDAKELKQDQKQALPVKVDAGHIHEHNGKLLHRDEISFLKELQKQGLLKPGRYHRKDLQSIAQANPHKDYPWSGFWKPPYSIVIDKKGVIHALYRKKEKPGRDGAVTVGEGGTGVVKFMQNQETEPGESDEWKIWKVIKANNAAIIRARNNEQKTIGDVEQKAAANIKKLWTEDAELASKAKEDEKNLLVKEPTNAQIMVDTFNKIQAIRAETARVIQQTQTWRAQKIDLIRSSINEQINQLRKDPTAIAKARASAIAEQGNLFEIGEAIGEKGEVYETAGGKFEFGMKFVPGKKEIFDVFNDDLGHLDTFLKLKKDKSRLGNAEYKLREQKFCQDNPFFKKLRDPVFLMKVTKNLLEALKWVRSRGLLHRDFKLENILIDADGNVKIIDWGFGLWKQDPKNLVDKKHEAYTSSSKLTQEGGLYCDGGFCGTLHSLAPEMLQELNGKLVGFNSDATEVFAMGVILETLLFGKRRIQKIHASRVEFVRSDSFKKETGPTVGNPNYVYSDLGAGVGDKDLSYELEPEFVDMVKSMCASEKDRPTVDQVLAVVNKSKYLQPQAAESQDEHKCAPKSQAQADPWGDDDDDDEFDEWDVYAPAERVVASGVGSGVGGVAASSMPSAAKQPQPTTATRQPVSSGHPSSMFSSTPAHSVGAVTGKPSSVPPVSSVPNRGSLPPVPIQAVFEKALQDGSLNAGNIRGLLDAKANINVFCSLGNTPLHAAAYHGRLSVVNALLEAKADPHKVNQRGQTALALAKQTAELVSNHQEMKAIVAALSGVPNAPVAAPLPSATSGLQKHGLYAHPQASTAAPSDVSDPERTPTPE